MTKNTKLILLALLIILIALFTYIVYQQRQAGVDLPPTDAAVSGLVQGDLGARAITPPPVNPTPAAPPPATGVQGAPAAGGEADDVPAGAPAPAAQ